MLRARVKFSTIAANEFGVVGLAKARNTTYDSIATHVWFRLDADMDILIEGDDGATDTDDVDTGINAFDGTYLDLQIDCADLSAVKFEIDGVSVSTEIAIPAATGTVQPFVGVGKASGTGTPSVTVDTLEVEWDR